MGMTYKSPDGNVHISKLVVAPGQVGKEEVRLAVTSSSGAGAVALRFEDARAIANSILSITDPKEESDEAGT